MILNADTGYRTVQFHVLGNLSSYNKDKILKIRETVAAILDCREEDILLNGIRPSTSFLLCLSVKEVYSWKLLDLIEQHRSKLMKLDIDYFIINKDTILLEGPKGKINHVFSFFSLVFQSYITGTLYVKSFYLKKKTCSNMLNKEVLIQKSTLPFCGKILISSNCVFRMYVGLL